jgi:hypothetical protein
MRDLVSAAEDHINSLKSKDKLDSNEKELGMILVLFLGEAGRLDRLTPAGMQRVAEPSLTAMTRGADITPDDWRELSSRAVLLLAGLMAKVPGTFGRPSMVRTLLAPLRSSDERVRGTAMSVLALVAHSLLKVPNLTKDALTKMAAPLLSFIQQYYGVVRAGGGFEVQHALLPRGTPACQMACIMVLDFMGVKMDYTGAFIGGKVQGLVNMFETFDLGKAETAAPTSVEAATNTIQSSQPGLYNRVLKAAGGFDGLQKLYRQMYFTLKANDALKNNVPVQKLVFMIYELNKGTGKSLAPQPGTELLTFIMEIQARLLERSNAFCGQQGEELVGELGNPTPDTATILTNLAALLQAAMSVLPMATSTVYLYANELTGVVALSLVGLRRVSFIIEDIPVKAFKRIMKGSFPGNPSTRLSWRCKCTRREAMRLRAPLSATCSPWAAAPCAACWSRWRS